MIKDKPNRPVTSNTHPLNTELVKTLKGREFPINTDKLSGDCYCDNHAQAEMGMKRYSNYMKTHKNICAKFSPAPSFKTSQAARMFPWYQIESMLNVADQTLNIADMRTVISKSAMAAASYVAGERLLSRYTLYKTYNDIMGDYPIFKEVKSGDFKFQSSVWHSFLIFGDYLPKLKLAKYTQVYRSNPTEKTYDYIDFYDLIKAYMQGKLSRNEIKSMYEHDIKYCDDVSRLLKTAPPKVTKPEVTRTKALTALNTIEVDSSLAELTGKPNAKVIAHKQGSARGQFELVLRMTAKAIPDPIERERVCGKLHSAFAFNVGIAAEELVLGWAGS
jgi:hypothetical protein